MFQDYYSLVLMNFAVIKCKESQELIIWRKCDTTPSTLKLIDILIRPIRNSVVHYTSFPCTIEKESNDKALTNFFKSSPVVVIRQTKSPCTFGL